MLSRCLPWLRQRLAGHEPCRHAIHKKTLPFFDRLDAVFIPISIMSFFSPLFCVLLWEFVMLSMSVDGPFRVRLTRGPMETTLLSDIYPNNIVQAFRWHGLERLYAIFVHFELVFGLHWSHT